MSSPTERTLPNSADTRPTSDSVPGTIGGNGETVTDTGVGIEDGLARLWAPYRSAYIAENGASGGAGASGAGSKSDDPFEDLPEKSDEEALIAAAPLIAHAGAQLPRP